MAAKKTGTTESIRSEAELVKRFSSENYAPAYLLEGSEDFLRGKAVDVLLEKAIDQGLRDFNFSEISVAKGNLDAALAQAREFPMMSKRRLVVVRGFEAIADEDQLELLKDYFRAPVDTTILVFDSPGLDNRRNISTILKKFAEVISFEPLDERESAPKWVAEQVRTLGCQIDSATASYLVGMAGTGLQLLASEVEKLCTYVGPGNRIAREDIDLLVRHSKVHSNFELVDLMVEGNRRKALTLLDHLFDGTNDKQGLAVMLVGAVARGYRNLLVSQEMMQQNATNAEVAKAVGMSPFAVTHLNEKARKVSPAIVQRALSRISQTDIAIKTSTGTPRLQIEMLVCELCGVASR